MPAAQVVPTGTVRQLIADLAQVEDAIRAAPAGAASGLHPDFVALVDREESIVAALRARRVPAYVCLQRPEPAISPAVAEEPS